MNFIHELNVIFNFMVERLVYGLVYGFGLCKYLLYVVLEVIADIYHHYGYIVTVTVILFLLLYHIILILLLLFLLSSILI